MMSRLLWFGLAWVALQAEAQVGRPTSSMYLTLPSKTDATLVFNIDSAGQRFQLTWGLDQAWINEQNLRKGINHMGRENIGVGRSAFRTTYALTNDSVLSADQTQHLRQRSDMFNIVRADLPLLFTADQEAGSDAYFVEDNKANVPHWAANINSHVHWMQANTNHKVIAVAPFNEPDYWIKEEGATANTQAEVARLLKERYGRFDEIAIVGANTLNNDKAWAWFAAGNDIFDWGNTHQLAGSMANYAAFHSSLADIGQTGCNDEMHNVAEAMVGLEYGMSVGIWWGFDSRTRGEFCDISRHGQRLAYVEHRNNWTAASVWRHDDGRVKAFIGSSERQGVTTNYRFVSPDREVYFDGHGPTRFFEISIPGGNGYQNGQVNAERVVDITWGDDVQPAAIEEGVYKIVNKATGNVVAINGSAITQQKWTGAVTQQWTIKPCSDRTGGDYSFYDIESLSDASLRINVKNFSTFPNAELIAWKQNGPTSNEQWYLVYAGNGYYFLRNRESALYMASAGTVSTNNVRVTQTYLQEGEAVDKLLWRLLPINVEYETTPPAKPLNLKCEVRDASVALSWTPVEDADVSGYMVLRSEAGSEEWNTIARGLVSPQFVDNSCRQGRQYLYKVKAIDWAQNISEASNIADAELVHKETLVARWQMDGSLLDDTYNEMDAVGSHDFEYVDDHKAGGKALRLIGSRKQHVRLPVEVASSEELTFCAWVNLRSSALRQHIFDFGNDEAHCMYLTPNNGSGMQFVYRNGDETTTVDCGLHLPFIEWKHVAVTIGDGIVDVYVDGAEVASAKASVRPDLLRPVLNYLGRSQSEDEPYFTGYLDDVRIYNYRLTADKINEVMADTASEVQLPSVSGQKNIGRYFTADGIRRSDTKKGIMMIDGKKVVVN